MSSSPSPSSSSSPVSASYSSSLSLPSSKLQKTINYPKKDSNSSSQEEHFLEYVPSIAASYRLPSSSHASSSFSLLSTTRLLETNSCPNKNPNYQELQFLENAPSIAASFPHLSTSIYSGGELHPNTNKKQLHEQYYLLKKLVFQKVAGLRRPCSQEVDELEKSYRSMEIEDPKGDAGFPTFESWNGYIEYVIYRMARFYFEEFPKGSDSEEDWENPDDNKYWFNMTVLYYDPISHSYPSLSRTSIENNFNFYQIAFTFTPSHRAGEKPVYLPYGGELVLTHSMRPGNLIWDDNATIVGFQPLDRKDAESLDVPLDLLPMMKNCWHSLNEAGTNIKFYTKQGQYGRLSNLPDYWRVAYRVTELYRAAIIRFLSDYHYVTGKTYNRQKMRSDLEEFHGFSASIEFQKQERGKVVLREFHYILDKNFKAISYQRRDKLRGKHFYLERFEDRYDAKRKMEY